MPSFKRVFCAALLVAAITVAGITATTASADPPLSSTDPVKISGCAVRLTSSGPYLHRNAMHSCAGLRSASIRNGNLYVAYDGGCVRSVMAVPDEALAARGIFTGGSGGGGTLSISFSRMVAETTMVGTGKTRRVGRVTLVPEKLDPRSSVITGARSNVWITSINESAVC